MGHAAVRARRGASYQSEITLAGQYGSLIVRGRADGYDPDRNQLEEIKTHRGDLERMPDNQRQLHWAQARIYGWLMCRKLGLQQIRLALVYFDIATRKETVLLELRSAEDLQANFESQCRRYSAWAEQESAHRHARDSALSALRFPHPEFRPGQRMLAENVYRAALAKRPLLAQAPTGIGKTIGTLFPMLKAMPGQALDKIFCLSAKTSGRALTLDTLQSSINADGRRVIPLRIVELVARDKACEYPDRACHGESCPLAQGFYDRLPAARRAAAAAPALLTRHKLREIALFHQVCPYYLSQEMVRWSDVVVGDYNYFFDLHAMLHAMTVQADWQVALLVDEAHNLIDRGRKMYSAELHPASLSAARRDAPQPAKRALDRVAREWSAITRDCEADYAVCALPDKLTFALLQAISSITDLMAEQPDRVRPELQQFCFDAMHFTRLAEMLDQHSLFDVTRVPRQRARDRSMLCIRNLVPAPWLAARLQAAASATLFSATLSPWHFYADMLGLPATTAWIDIPPPFRPEQLAVRIVADVSTRYRDRDDSLAAIATLIGEQYARKPGNYLAFFSSFDYLQKVLALFRARYPSVPAWEQARAMEEAARDQFLARFEADGCGIGFAVLGGAFAEGIDLPGSRLIGAFIATLGMPQVNPVNQQICQRMDALFGAGYLYTYFYPGLQKVIQAAGRVIRSESDSGVLYLVDDRYARSDVRELLPQWWQPTTVRADDVSALAQSQISLPAIG